MASVTFTIGDKKVRISTIKEKRPSGLSAIGWNGHNNAHVNIRVNNVVYGNAGSISAIKGGYYFYIGSEYNLWSHKNTANKPVASFELAFNDLVDFVKGELACYLLQSHLDKQI